MSIEAKDEGGLTSIVEVALLLDHTEPTIGNLTAGHFAADELNGVLGPEQTTLHDTVPGAKR